ncbi:sirohydrochlorin cobaltochelatase, partial [Brachyspira intermedia]
MVNKSIILLFHGAKNYTNTNLMYERIIQKFKDEFKDFYIVDAYSSTAIKKIISDNVHFPSVIERLEELKKSKINEVYISPIVLLQNKDYMKIFHSIVKYKSSYDILKYG